MSNYQYSQGAASQTADMSVDAGLRGFMLGIYNKMALGLVLSAVIAYVVGTVDPVTALVLGTPLRFVVMFGPIAILLVSSFAMKNPSPLASGIIYWSVVSLLGAGLGALVLTYAAIPNGFTTIGKAFFVTAAAFGGLSLWGYTTKKDLSGFGTFLIMGLIGIIVASVVNMFMQSSMMEFIISVGGVLIFSGLIAFDTQRLKHTYYALGGDTRSMAVATNYGALSLYLNFINLFQFILSLMGRD
ncbi:Bax inhibitor-1/YccA family protein [Hirschia litorea]|uniref:Bax inhibitor-1/YccA family protein n=1 Tax=Hirschia litorea TaxID=1199156 RepID=A0ABW2IMU9_9PROT